ncbi:hypothetical protein JZO70_17175 [Enterococcus sp. 669A]|uniref:ENT domain-containing protein n=1 Tax=Candidatus Enterococcus moelleringii TaxID=2815325 RepID=A0ABS3LE61_9ENTE|nr:hypothetical protein [Enterococcus sp. 669A]MBO1307910.1 hypothetical protein [Enterococcus sp. 669A]
MINLSREIKDRVGGICNEVGKFYIAPEIPQKKLNNAIKAIAPNETPDYIIAIVDTTLLGSAKEGIVFLGDKIIIKEMLSKPINIEFSQLEGVSYNEFTKVDTKGKEKKEISMEVTTKETSYTISSGMFGYVNGQALEEFLQIIIDANATQDMAEIDNIYTKENQLMPLELLDESIKVCYVKVLCNYAISSGDIIDSEEYAAIISFIVKINISSENRIKLRGYMLNDALLEDTQDLLAILESATEDTEFDIVKKSLMKDILSIYKINNTLTEWREDAYLLNLASIVKISEDELQVLAEAIQYDEDIIAQRYDDTQITKSLKDLSAKAVAVGVPMTALYFSGTVGVSAIGMTTGLATLGMGGVLGFSSMFTGIGAIALIGVGAYQGMKKVTGIKDLENSKQREKFLQEILKNSQKTLNILIEDVNTISKMLIAEIENGKETQLKIKKLAVIIDMLSNSASNVDSKINYLEREKIVTKLPVEINKNRLEELTRAATLHEAKVYVEDCYSKDENKLRDDLELADMQQLYNVLNEVGYLNLKDASIASAKSGVKRFAKGLLNSAENEE